MLRIVTRQLWRDFCDKYYLRVPKTADILQEDIRCNEIIRFADPNNLNADLDLAFNLSAPIRIQLFNVVRIRILLLIKVLRIWYMVYRPSRDPS